MTDRKDTVSSTVSIDDVKSVVVETLGVEDRAAGFDAATPLLGALPELDSMAVLELVQALETRFDVEFEDDDVSAEVFETLATLTELVGSKRR